MALVSSFLVICSVIFSFPCRLMRKKMSGWGDTISNIRLLFPSDPMRKQNVLSKEIRTDIHRCFFFHSGLRSACM